MAAPRNLRNAPVKEAVIDFRVRAAEVKMSALKEAAASLENYPRQEAMNVLEFGFASQPGKAPQHLHRDHGVIGYRCASADGRRIVQIRKDGFTFSRLVPYGSWEEAFGEAAQIYPRYLEVVPAEEVQRVAVRYINRMPLQESEVGDFSRYLVCPPPLPPKVPLFLSHFLTQVRIKDPDSNVEATISQTIQQGGHAESGIVPVILDIDVFETGNFSPDPALILRRFDALRAMKNHLFFASITEEAATLFE